MIGCTKNVQPICCIRGTTLPLYITLTDEDGKPYEMKPGQVLRFGVKSSARDTSYKIVKTATSANIEDGKYRITINPKDTENLSIAEYYYDVGLQDGSQYFNVIPYSPFVVAENITSLEG